MSVKNNGQRVFIIVIVAVFFLTAVASAGFALYDALSNKDNAAKTTTPTAEEQLSQLQNQSTPQEGKLEGTKLANYTPVEKVDQIQIVDLVPGTGAEVAQNATVTAHYTGALAKDGTIFQSSKDTGQPFTSELSGLIPGWQQGIPGMKVGGTRRLILPSSLAYGEQGAGNIPPNSDLVFDIELVDTK